LKSEIHFIRRAVSDPIWTGEVNLTSPEQRIDIHYSRNVLDTGTREHVENIPQALKAPQAYCATPGVVI